VVKEAYTLRDGKNIVDKSQTEGDQDKGWYKSWPYAFVANINDKQKVFYLPISPQNLNITTNFATNIIATLHSTVEEHSEVRYYDIVIQGTTGFVPLYNKESNFSSPMNLKTSINSRKNYGGSIIQSDAAGGFMRRTMALAQAAANSASDLLIPRVHEAGVFTDNNGYVAFHNLYRFLLKHKTSITNTTKRSETPPLLFLNYKDNNQYSCVVQRFTLERNAENPMLYNYQIQMRGYDLKTIAKRLEDEGGLTNRYELLGLKETSKSLAAKLAAKVRLAKNGVNAARNLVGSVGR
jgi:hypothetical protein